MINMELSNITRAKGKIIMLHPFFASLLLPMPITEDKTGEVKTMRTDGESIEYNAKWVGKLDLSETMFLLAHEVMHCVFLHMCRRGSRTPNRWNQAGDYIINDLLTKENVGNMPKGGLYNPQLVAQGGNTAEGIYDLLPEDSEQKGAGSPGGALDEMKDAGTEMGSKQTDPAKLKQKEAEMRVKIIQAKNAAKMQGQLSGELERLIDTLVKTKTDWRAILRRFITERAKIDYSFAKPKRRYLAEDIILPSQTGEQIGRIAFAIDCSGSIGDDMLRLFAGEIKGVCEDAKPKELTVMYFDTKVFNVETFPEGTDPVFRSVGGGGTAFSPIFEEIAKWPEPPIALVVLTDLCCNDFGPQPGYPVLWATTDLEKAPFGEIVKIGED